MIWLKKMILFIPSTFLIVLTSCNSVDNKTDSEQGNTISKEELISELFSRIQTWNDQTISLIDSLGFEIDHIDSSLTFLPYSNEHENNSFIFIANDRKSFKPFEESSFLSENIKIQRKKYRVWRKHINNLQILDISIEPHPSLNWVLIIRFRDQE